LGFESGEPALDRYFAEHAVANSRRGIGKAFVLRSPPGAPDLPAVIGFYTLSMAALERTALPVSTQKGVPAYPMPVALIGRFAIDRRAQRQGFGRVLLQDALERVLAVSEDIGCFGVLVDAKNGAAVAFYRSTGFEPTAPEPGAFPCRMFLPMKTLRGARKPTAPDPT